MGKTLQKMYETLVGRVDTSICNLVNIAMRDPCSKEHILKVAEDLRQALMEVEDIYLDSEDKPLS